MKVQRIQPKKIDDRLPAHLGCKVYAQYAAAKSPWEKLASYYDMMHYVMRYNSVVSAAAAQAAKILLPDYEERATLMCESSYRQYYAAVATPGSPLHRDAMRKDLNMHPFCRGNFVAGLRGDDGDEAIMLCGRVNDFGTYRVEKELDTCDWDIIGSDFCRATTVVMQAQADALTDGPDAVLQAGPKVEFSMVEAMGCGDRHCRLIAENREKYPMPERKIFESFGPIATEDQIKFTPDDKCLKEPMFFRKECDFCYQSGTNREVDDTALFGFTSFATGAGIYFAAIDAAVEKGMITRSQAEHTFKCCCEAAGKAMFAEFYAKEGLRQWLGVPREIANDDPRVMGGHVEMYLQGCGIGYEIEQFNAEGVAYVIDRVNAFGDPLYVDWCMVPYWYGASKTLIGSRWFLEESDSPAGKLRIQIVKKIDKYC